MFLFMWIEQQYYFQDDLLVWQFSGIMRFHETFVWATIFVITVDHCTDVPHFQDS